MIYDEQGVSGRDLAKRSVARSMLDGVAADGIQAIAAYDIKRLTRDEFGADAGTIAKRLARARAVLVTNTRIYRLWEKDDKAVLRMEAAISGRDVEDIRDTFWRGIFARASREPFFIGLPPLGYATKIVEIVGTRVGERTRIKRVPTKNPSHAELMADIVRWLDECPVLGEVARRAVEKHGDALETHHRRRHNRKHNGFRAQNISDMLQNPVYTGRFVFGRRVPRESVVWDTDDRRQRPDDFTLYVPELAYWTPAQSVRWMRKFHPKPGMPAKRACTHLHPLLGVLACPACGLHLVGNGSLGYACPKKQSATCSDPETISEKKARQVLRTILPDLFGTTDWLISAAQRQALSDDVSAVKALQSKLAILEEKLETMAEEWYGGDAVKGVPKPIRERMVSIEEEIEHLKAQIIEEEANQQTTVELAGLCEMLKGDPLGLFDELDTDKQGAVYRLLLSDVKVKGTGHAAGRKHHIISYRNSLTNTVVAVADEYWCNDDASGITCPSTVALSKGTGCLCFAVGSGSPKLFVRSFTQRG